MKRILSLAGVLLLCCVSCIKVDESLGRGLLDKSLIYESYTVEFPLTKIRMEAAEDLSGYSSARVVIGAIRDDVFGLSTRESAFPLVPVLDTIDFGTGPVAKSFTLYFEADTVSCATDSEAHIIQNVNVTELTAPLDKKRQKNTMDIPHGNERITEGIPTYNGSGPLRLNFSQKFAQKYVDEIAKLGPILKDRVNEDGVDKYEDYVSALPGIYISCDNPDGNGGRINLFNLSCLSVSDSYYYRNSNVAILKVNSTWNGVQKDSSFMFIPGEIAFEDEVSALENNTKFYQYAFNRTSHSLAPSTPTDRILVEGGGGLKPVISALEIQEGVKKAISEKGGNPDNVIISKATIVLPFEMTEDYRDMKYFPTVLSPTIQKTDTDDEGTETISFAGLTDASVSSENQGDIDRSNLMYCPDISYHLQGILKRTDLDTAKDADIWLLTIHTDQVANANGSLYDNSYYQSLMYAAYYNSLYGGGYGGYGYGSYGYGSGYGNYYSYMLMAQMMAAQNQQTYSYNTELDKDRYYRGILCGPSSTRAPYFKVTFAISE